MRQETLLEVPEQPEGVALVELPPQPVSTRQQRPKMHAADRSRLVLTAIRLDDLLPVEHKARAIVALLERTDTCAFQTGVRTFDARAGRSMRDPQTLLAVILY